MRKCAAVRTVRLRPDCGLSRVKDITSKISEFETTLELDSHADTCVLGRDALIIYDYDRPVEVTGFDPALGSHRYSTVSGVVKFTHPASGERFHLVIHQAIHTPHLLHHLLCPMQCHMNDVTVNDVPKFLTDDPTENTHAIIVQSDDAYDSAQTVLPLKLGRVISFLNVSKPSPDEWTTAECTRLVLTNEHLTWDPNDPSFADQENAQTDSFGDVRRRNHRPLTVQALSTDLSAADVTHDDNFAAFLDSHVAVDVADSLTASGAVRSRTHKAIDHLTLAHGWGLAPDCALQTIDRTTQRGVRTCLYPSLSR